jgi:hypothetical protein
VGIKALGLPGRCVIERRFGTADMWANCGVVRRTVDKQLAFIGAGEGLKARAWGAEGSLGAWRAHLGTSEREVPLAKMENGKDTSLRSALLTQLFPPVPRCRRSAPLPAHPKR